jgi:hypothetical protein
MAFTTAQAIVARHRARDFLRGGDTPYNTTKADIDAGLASAVTYFENTAATARASFDGTVFSGLTNAQKNELLRIVLDVRFGV